MVDVFGWFKKEVPIIEQDVLNFIKAVETNIGVGITDAEKALQWIANQAPNIAQDVQMLAGFVGAVPGVISNPEVAAAVTAANLAVQGLNAFATSYNQSTVGGGITLTSATQAIVQGYQAVKAAQAATAIASKTAVASTTTATTTPAATS